MSRPAPDASAGLGVAEPEGAVVADEERSIDAGPAEVRLVLPATPRFLRVARLAAASLVTELGVDLEGVEDVRVAIDELAAAVIAGAPDGATLDLRFVLEGSRLTVEGHVAGRWDQPFSLHPVATALLEIVADQYAAEQTEAGRTFRLEVDAGGADGSP